MMMTEFADIEEVLIFSLRLLVLTTMGRILWRLPLHM